MTLAESENSLGQARKTLNLSTTDVWWDYFALGGMLTPLEVDAVLFGALVGTDDDRDLLAAAMNERFARIGRDHPLPYHSEPPADQ